MTRHAAIVRLPDWRPRLTAYLGQVLRTPFGYEEGELDCMGFAAGAVAAMTGADLAEGWRGYRSAEEGRARLRAKGYATQRGLLASLLRPMPPALARPGDLVVLPREAIGVCQGRLAYAMGPGGVVLLEMADARRSYRVPILEDEARG